ncbi:glycosyltransferase family A protein [Zunongwangia sp. F260]|uniref:Glycosyltransferase family A protein n=1 Tax=Autumnicola lenta TaxID=3075593 RepID=A0ABU3CG18_9FLAO|nr:glycosyltransferase family A protein [Zunongwangia sp. F260]MDT0645306.1 glycosyltransferase family A protein [Zunongwangia sp. F260]
MTRLAVLMPTYNAGSYIRDSIDSILNQTFEDFHLYIYDDCSTDDTEDIVAGYDDQRLFYKKNQENLGIAKTLNKGLDYLLPHYKYVARMDADDWSYPQRFELQLKMFEQDADLIMCGTQGYWLTDLNKIPLNKWKYPNDYKTLRISLLFSGSFGH